MCLLEKYGENEMGLFGKKEDTASENSEESVLKEELETEVENYKTSLEENKMN